MQRQPQIEVQPNPDKATGSGEYDDKGRCAHCHLKNHPKSQCWKPHKHLRSGNSPERPGGYAGTNEKGRGRR